MTLHPDIERVALLGWHVYPASNYSKAACFEGASRAASCDLDTIAGWAKQYPACNWRVVCGPSAIWGFDLDVSGVTHKHDGIKAFADLVQANGPLPKRPTMRSGGGGLAIFFRHEGQPIVGQSGYPALGIDPRRGQQSQTIPPSRHIVTGKPYHWIKPPWEISPPAAPVWVLELVKPKPELAPEKREIPMAGAPARRYAVAALHNAVRKVAGAAEGGRNDALNRACYGLARFVTTGTLAEDEIRDCLVAAARACGLPVREAALTIDSAVKARRR